MLSLVRFHTLSLPALAPLPWSLSSSACLLILYCLTLSFQVINAESFIFDILLDLIPPPSLFICISPTFSSHRAPYSLSLSSYRCCPFIVCPEYLFSPRTCVLCLPATTIYPSLFLPLLVFALENCNINIVVRLWWFLLRDSGDFFAAGVCRPSEEKSRRLVSPGRTHLPLLRRIRRSYAPWIHGVAAAVVTSAADSVIDTLTRIHLRFPVLLYNLPVC